MKLTSEKLKHLTGKVSRNVVDLPPSGIRKFFDFAMGMENIISLGVGEPDFATPWGIREAAVYSLERGRTSYTSNRGLPKLRQAIAAYLRKRWRCSYDPEKEITITVGVSQGIDLLMRSILNPGDEVIIFEPCYVSYSPMVLLAGGTPVALPTYAKDDFAPDIERLKQAVTPRTKAIFLNYPCNPTGSTFRRADLERIVALAKKHDLLLISDEVYAELSYDEEDHVSLPSIPGAQERTILLSGFSKAWAMTGWRIGYIAGPEPFISAVVKVHQYSMLCAPIMGQLAAIEALESGEEAMKEMCASYLERRNVIVDGLNRLGLSCNMPHGAFYVFPNIESTGMTGDDFAWKLLEQKQVALVPGTAFGACGEGHIRCSYATSLTQIQEALNRIEDFLAQRR
ncbi:aminotransferase class I/II-fold pyridoxal phosphate-dependent enzyme [Candidatus Sumerlaeota bacterium]|nr:aminotransferase class I/II-fold pyridoxal phosphate-dependent enzyme [Candidatus Sumerlaeota bacterium]